MPRPEELLKLVGVGRFQVMALLQAARYYLLHGDLEKAKSFGLNRAIFYAWAKYYGPRGRPRYAGIEELLRRVERAKREGKCPEGFVEVDGDCVQVGPRGYYAIGGEEQTPRDFDREVVMKVSRVVDWEKAWKAALEYVKSFPETVLRDPQKFYRLVYEPVRDTFFVKLLKGEEVKPPRMIMEKLRALEELEKRARRARQTSLLGFMGGKGGSGTSGGGEREHGS